MVIFIYNHQQNNVGGFFLPKALCRVRKNLKRCQNLITLFSSRELKVLQLSRYLSSQAKNSGISPCRRWLTTLGVMLGKVCNAKRH